MTDAPREEFPRILVVGGSGPIGRAVLRVGRSMDMHVDSASRRGPIVIDVTEPALADRVIARSRPDALVYLVTSASPAAEGEPGLAVERMTAVVRSAAAHGARRIVLASSAAVYGDQARWPLTESSALEGTSPYAREKRASERALDPLAEELGISAVSLRIFNVFGDGCVRSLINALTDGPPPQLAMTPSFVRDYVHVDDVARAIVQAITRPEVTGAVNIACGVAVDNIMLANAAPGAFDAVQQNLDSYSVADISRAHAALDWHPRVDVLDYLSQRRPG